MNMHLDYGLKGTATNANPCNDGLPDRYDPANLDPIFGGWDALQDTSSNNGPLALANGVFYSFAHTDGKVAFSDFVQNFNDFTKIPGVLGRVYRSDTNQGVQGVRVTLRNAAGALVGSNLSNHDGNYTLLFDHTGKPANYVVATPDLGLQLQVRLTAHQSRRSTSICSRARQPRFPSSRRALCAVARHFMRWQNAVTAKCRNVRTVPVAVVGGRCPWYGNQSHAEESGRRASSASIWSGRCSSRRQVPRRSARGRGGLRRGVRGASYRARRAHRHQGAQGEAG